VGEPVRFEGQAWFVVDCDPDSGEVLKVTVLGSHAPLHLLRDDGHDPETVERALRWLSGHEWEPLRRLPEQVTWQ
jgi:hypothetical protein